MFELIDETPWFVVVNKFPGVSFHAQDGEAGLTEAVKSALELERLYPVHRLDKITSGLLIFAKTAEIAAEFGRLFENKQVEKYYLAISDRKPKKKQGLIRGDMLKGRNGSWMLSKSLENPAVTQFFSYALEPGIRLYLLKPHTGKTHQLRVALKSLGAPILGDRRYYPAESDLQPERGYLHAWCVRFRLNTPQGAHDYCFTAPLLGAQFESEICQAQLATLSTPWLLPWPALKAK